VAELEKILEALGGERRIDYSLNRFQRALASIGNPEKNVQTLVIAGTNGKGTVSLLLSSALREAGFSVGTYLSPHLQAVQERFLHNLTPIKEAPLDALAVELEPVAKSHDLTYFEFLTLIHYVWSSREGFDFNVMECGLGGRLDATNVNDPIATVITNISYDHQEYLGDTLEKILEEKMGVLRPEALLFTGVREKALLERIDQRCLELDAIPYFAKEIQTKITGIFPDRQTVTFNDYPFTLSNPSQTAVENASLAFLLMRIVFPKIPMEILHQAFAQVKNPGRMETVQENPRVILSGDHNPAGIASLIETLERSGIHRPKIICAFSPDKPHAEMYRSLAEISGEITLTSVPRLRDKMPAAYFELGPYVENPVQAVEQVLGRAQPSDTLVITGSLYLIGEVRGLWRETAVFR